MRLIHINGTPDVGEARVRFDSGDPIFAGHFPHGPVLPGVALIDAAIGIVARIQQQNLCLVSLKVVKFVNAVLPDEEITFTFKAKPAINQPQARVINGRWTRQGEKIADLTVTASPVAKESSI